MSIISQKPIDVPFNESKTIRLQFPSSYYEEQQEDGRLFKFIVYETVGGTEIFSIQVRIPKKENPDSPIWKSLLLEDFERMAAEMIKINWR